MIDIKRILLPTDFSDYAAEATPYVCGLVDAFGSELHLLHVIEDFAASLPEPLMEHVESLAQHRDDAELRALERMADVLDADWRKARHVVRATREGAPFVEIVRYARENDIDLIVMATHGRGGLAHALIGSVAERVVRKAHCPVLTVRPGGHEFHMP